MYWLPKLHKRRIKLNSLQTLALALTCTDLFKLFTSCLTSVKSRVIMNCETEYERSRKKCNRVIGVIS